MDVLGLVVVFVVMIGVLVLVLGGLRPDVSHSRLGDPAIPDGSAIGVVAPFVTMFAAISVLELSGGRPADGARVGALFGLLAVLCTLGGGAVRRLVEALGSLLGAVATVAVAAAYVGGLTCGAPQLGVRVLQLTFMAALFGFSLLHTIFLRPIRLTTVGLSAFGAVETLVFLSSPFGTQLGAGGFVVSMVAALGLGAAAGLVPDLVTTLAAVGVAVMSIGVTTVVGDACAAPGAGPGLTAMVGFAAVLVIGTAFTTPLRRLGSASRS